MLRSSYIKPSMGKTKHLGEHVIAMKIYSKAKRAKEFFLLMLAILIVVEIASTSIGFGACVNGKIADGTYTGSTDTAAITFKMTNNTMSIFKIVFLYDTECGGYDGGTISSGTGALGTVSGCSFNWNLADSEKTFQLGFSGTFPSTNNTASGNYKYSDTDGCTGSGSWSATNGTAPTPTPTPKPTSTPMPTSTPAPWPTPTPTPPPEPSSKTAYKDFNGDGISDVLWQNVNTGMVYIYLINNDGSMHSSGSPATVSDRNWNIKDVGDYNGDGKSDILWQNNQTGLIYIWFMDGVNIKGYKQLGLVPDSEWHIFN
ncbi:MAG: VCBS repeat-containing protein [Nitrospirae bacterium]|nr:VCBS repeat-containing protein [Nitrospirota bacterium]